MARKGTLSKTLRLPDGTRKWVTAKTQEELDKKVLDLQIQLSLGVDLNNHDTFGEYALLWYKTYKEEHLRQKSKESLLNTLNTHLLPLLSGYRMRDITPMQIQQVFNLKKNLSASTNTKIKTTLNALFRTAVQNGVIPRSPMSKDTLSVGGKAAKEKKPLTPAQADTILETLRNSKDSYDARAYLFALLGLKTGLRRGELCGLMWSDINFEKRELTVTHNCVWAKNKDAEITTDLKTDAANRTVPLTDAVVAALKAERAKGQSLFVLHLSDGRPLSFTASTKMIARIAKAAPKGAKVTAHILRHTFCTRLFESNLDIKEVQYLMGHSQPEMTLRVYTHYCQESRYENTADKVRAAM